MMQRVRGGAAWRGLGVSGLAAAVWTVATVSAQQGPAVGAELPYEFQAGSQRVRVVRIADGLVSPWSLGFLPDGTILVSERTGRVRMIRNDVLEPAPVWEAPPEPLAQEGADRIHWLAVHPDFSQNRLVYLSYVKYGERGTTLAVARGRFDGTTLTGVEDVFVADAWETGGNLAGKLLFGPDRTLYVTVGDRDRLCCTGTEDKRLRMKAQALDNHVGKTLRIRDDGSIPRDNPFVNRPEVKPEIYTYGHRNGYGLAFHPVTGVLWQIEIGPLGGDELNVLIPGHNYGWPLVSMGRNYTGSLVSDQPWHRPGMEDPRMFWVPSISPSSLAFYTGDQFPAWKGSLFVGGLTTRELQRVYFNQPSQFERRQMLLRDLNVRPRDVAQGPDGSLYLATEQASGSEAPTGMVLRLEPVG